MLLTLSIFANIKVVGWMISQAYHEGHHRIQCVTSINALHRSGRVDDFTSIS